MESVNHNFWLEVFSSLDGVEVIQPTNVLEYIKTTKSNIPFDFVQTELNSIYDFLIADFDFFKDLYIKKQQGLKDEFDDSTVNLLKGLIVWIKNTIEFWCVENDSNLKVLSLILYISRILDDNLWRYIDQSIIASSLEDAVVRRLISFHINITIPDDQEVPIWEKEHVERFQKALDERDWVTLSDTWLGFKRSPNFNRNSTLFQEQIFLFGITCCREKLVIAFDHYYDFLSMMLLFDRCKFSFYDRFLLALESDNLLLKFALLFSLELRNDIEFSEEENELLAKIFRSVSNNKIITKSWFRIFNRHLVRYYFFSKAFGIYLAKYADDDGMDIYLNSLGNYKLHCNPNHGNYDDRDIVTEVFIQFDTLADNVKKKLFWEKCYKKYKVYDFGSQESDFFMSTVCYTIFDYSVVCYFVESISSTELEVICNEIMLSLRNFDMNWYSSESAYISHFYKYLSLAQPIYHAYDVTKTKQKKLQNIDEEPYLPDFLVNNKRLALSLNLPICVSNV